MKERKIYAIEHIYLDKTYHEYTDEEFIKLVEENGEIYTLEEFENNFNDSWRCPSSETHYIRII